MAEAFRRFLWLLPVFLSGAVGLFFALASISTLKAQLNRPLFYNPHPISAERAAVDALEMLKSDSLEGQKRILELGGAALPTILARLPSLELSQRRRVASALVPVAKRMELDQGSFAAASIAPIDSVGATSRKTSDEELLFWEHFRDEHGLDLRPLSVTRLVRRVAERENYRRSADLLAVDAYALPTMIGMLGRIRSEADIARAQRLVTMISRLSGEDWSIPQEASVDQTKRVVTNVRDYWDRYGGQWTALDRFSLLVARFTQTEFAAWVFRSARQVSGMDSSRSVRRLVRVGRNSLNLLLFSFIGLLAIGPALATTIQVLQLRRSDWSLERWGLRAGLSIGLIALIPLLVFPQMASSPQTSLAALLAGTLFSTFILHRELSDRLDWRTHHVLRARPKLQRVYAIARWLAPTVPTLAPIFLLEAALWITCLEMSSNTPGLGSETIIALRTGNLDFLMLICLAMGLLTGTLQVLADLFLGSGRSQEGGFL